MASDDKNKQNQIAPAPVSQVGATVGAGYPAPISNLPGNISGNRPVVANVSVSGQTPIVNR
jgi:hypothetical protein